MKIIKHFEHIPSLGCDSQRAMACYLNAVGKDVQTEYIVTTLPFTLSKQQISNGSDGSQVHNGKNDTVSDHIGVVKENSNDHRISSRSRKIPVIRQNDFFYGYPTLGLEEYCKCHPN